MKKLMLAAGLAVLPFAALADNSLVQKAKAAVPVKSAAQENKASRVVRLSDVELDKIVAGDATQLATGHGFTVILNPGNANVLKLHKNGGVTCINCF